MEFIQEQILPPFYSSIKVMRMNGDAIKMLDFDLWRFKSEKTSRKYFVRMERYENDIYAVKFYPADYRDSWRKYQLMTGDGEPKRIIKTVLQIIRLYADKESKASFAFFGVRNENEKTANNKRFRFYKRMIADTKMFLDFRHFIDTNKSAYMMVRNQRLESQEITIESITRFFEEYYNYSE